MKRPEFVVAVLLLAFLVGSMADSPNVPFPALLAGCATVGGLLFGGMLISTFPRGGRRR